VIEDLNNHLTDQEFFTYVKFFDMVICKNNLDTEPRDGRVSVYELSIGDDEPYHRFSRLYQFVKYKDILVEVSGGKFGNLPQSINAYNPDKNDSNKPTKLEIKTLYEIIEHGEQIKFTETGQLSWAWFDVYNNTRFLPHEYKISDKIKMQSKPR